jgi:predicted Zn-dependent protease
MEIDRGDHEFGFMLLNMARTQDTSLYSLVAREEALLQVANGEYFFAGIGFDLGSLTPADWVRAGIYAGHKGNRPAALEAFRRAIELDSTNVAPYLEMGRISLRTGDSLALENLQPGLLRDPNNIPLGVEMARAEWQRNNRGAAEARLKKLSSAAPDAFEVKCLQAELAAWKGDTAAAIAQYQALYKGYPLRQDVVLPLCRLMRAKRMDYDGQNLLADVLAINPRNPDYWIEMAMFERLLDRTEEVARAAQTAIGLETRPGKAALIAEEFKVEMAAFPTTVPEE